MIRTGIFGGSFNPIHNGHIQLADELCRRGYVDEVWLMVSPQNPLKVHSDLLDESIRLELARMATAGKQHIAVSDFEFHLPRPSYMWRTLEELAHTYSEREFCLIIGADNWFCFDRWRNAEVIWRDYTIIVYPREGYATAARPTPPDAKRVVMADDLPLFKMSSTEIREMIRSGRSTASFLPEAVAEAIAQKRYYA